MGVNHHKKNKIQSKDYYATDPKAVELLLKKETFTKNILEPACGEGHISKVLTKHGYNVYSSDIVDRGFGEVKDFFNFECCRTDIITNPPKDILEFLKHALNIVPNGIKIALFLRTLFLEGKERGHFFKENPPKKIYVSSSRLICAKNGDFEKYKQSNAQSYSWFIWEKGFKGESTVDWINL